MTFTEQLICRKKQAREWGILILIWSAAALLSLCALWLVLWLAAKTGTPLMTPFATWLLVTGMLAFVGVWLSKTQYIEYEYSVFEGDLEIDRILGKRKRSRVVQVPSHKIEGLFPCTEELWSRPFNRVVEAVPSRAEASWYVTYHSKKNGHTLVLLAPNDRTLTALYEGLPRRIQLDTEKACRETGRVAPWQ